MKNRLKFIVPIALLLTALVWYVRSTGDGDGLTLAASGTVEATDADLGFQVPGRVSEILVAEGQAVSGGEQLARLDTRELEAALGSARAQLAAARARLAEMLEGARPQEIATAEAALHSAEQRAGEADRELERSRTLHGGGAISRQALDRAETGVEVARAVRDQAQQALALIVEGPRSEAINAQRALVEQALANVTRADATLANAVITAPFPGLVTVKHREPGEAAAPGAPILTLIDPEDRWVRIYVREDQIGRVQLGAEAEIVSDTYPDRRYGGEVVFIGSEAEFTPRNVQTAEERTKLVYPVKVRITDDTDFALKPGVPADVTIMEPGA